MPTRRPGPPLRGRRRERRDLEEPIVKARLSRTEHGSSVGRVRMAELPAACAQTMHRLAERRLVLLSRRRCILLTGDLMRGKETRSSG
jgi:hypothetical protein